MSATKDTQEVPKKPSSEAKRIIQNDQEKQRKEKIKTCIGEIAKELPPSADHVDRKPSTLSIVSQAKDYIKSLKEKNQAYEKNFSVAEQEELKRLREIHAAQQEKIKQLEETVKAYALDKVIKNKSTDETNPTPSSEGRQGRPKTIKLLEKERHEQIQPANTEFNTLDPSLPLVSSTYGHHGSGGGSNNSNNLPPTSIVLPAASSGISIMTVAPTILSVKSPSLGQTRNQQTNRSISTSSVAGSTASSRVNPTSSTLVSYMDLIGNDYGSGNARVDSGQSNLVYSTSSMSLTSPSILSTSSGNIISTADLMGLQQQQHQSTGNVNGSTAGATGLVGNLQTADYSLLHHQQQGIMNLHQDGSCSTSALQTLASVATSSHMAGLTMSNNQGVGATSSMMGLPVGVPSMSLGHLHQQQGSILTDTGAASTQACKQVYINGQVLTLSDQGLSCGPHGESDCQSNIQASSLCQQLPLAAGTNFQQHQHSGINTAGLLNQGSFSHAASINTNQMTANNPNQSVIYTINEQGQLVPLQSSFNQIQPATGTGLDFVSVSSAGGNILSGFQNTSAGSGALMQPSLQHQTQPNFLTQAPIVSLAGQGSNQQFTILQAGHGNHLSNQIIPSAPLFMAQQNQVLNLAGLSGLQMVNPFSNMMVNNMANTLNGATVKLVGNELKIVQPGDGSASQGPTHVMVDGSLIPISTNPQTIMPTATAPLSTLAQKQQQQLSLGGNSILQFDPNNPSAPPILISGPVTTFQMAPQLLGASALHSPALSTQHGILQMASAGTNVTMGSSTPFQLGGAGGLAVASSMVASTVTTNSVTACISSPSVSAATKGPKGLPPLAPALSQASPTIGSTVAINSGYQTMLTTGMPQQFILNGQKIVTSKMATSSLATQGSKSAQNRKRSPSASRVSPIAAVDITQHFTQQQLVASTASAMVAPMQTVKSSSGVDKSCKTKSSKVSRQQAQQQEEKAVNQLMKTDLLAQATATAGILMDSETGAGDYAVNSSGANESNLNISAGSNMNLSSSSAELQINLKHSPRDEEDDNVQLIIDENCMSGMSSTSPAHSSFSPNMSLGSALSVNTSSSVFTHDLGLGGSQHQSVHLHPSNGDLTTPLVSPNITSSTTMSKQHKQITSSPITGLPTIQQLSPLSFTPVTSSASISNPSTTSEMHIMGGSFRPEDVFARFAAENKLKLSPDKLSPYSTSGSGNLSANNVFDVASSLSLPISSTSISASSAIKSYVPIAPAPAKASAAAPFAQDSTQTLTFMEAMNQASLGSDKPAGKSKSRSRKTSTPILPPAPVPQIITIEPDVPTIQQNDGKKKAANKKRKTKAELRQEKEERERVAREEFAERKLREAEVFDKTCVTTVSKQVSSIDEDSLIPVLNENDAVKEQILHSVSESKLLNTDGSQISLMDMVDKIEIFNSAVSDAEDGFQLGGQSNLVDTVACNTLSKEDTGGDKPDSRSVKCDAAKKRKGDIQPIPMAPPGQKADNKRPKKPTKVEATKPMGNSDVLMFGLGNSGPPSVSSASSDIYAFVDEEDNGLSLSFLQQPPTPAAKSPTKKNRKSKSAKTAVPETPIKPDTKTVNSLPGAIGNNIIMTRSETKNSNKASNSRQPQQVSAVTSKSSSENSLATSTVIPAMAGAPPVPSPSTLIMPKSPPSFSALQSKSQVAMPAPLTVVTTSNSSPIAKPTMTSTFSPATSNSNSFMPKKVTQSSESSVHASLEESLMDFSVMDFQSSPKLSEAHDDHDNSIGLPAETIADFFNQHSPSKMMLNTSPTNLQNGVLSPSDVDLPALRTPATPMNHNHTDPVLMLDTQDNKEMVSLSPSNKQPQSRMHTPPPMDPKSPANSLPANMSIASSTPGPSLSLTQSSSSPLPPPVMSSTNMTSSSQSSCMNSSSNALHHLDPTSTASTRPESPMPSLSSSSLDALSEIIPLKPITSELESEENESCAQKQRRPTPVQTQPLSHVPLSSDIGMVMSSMPELQQKSQPQRPNPPHLPPQSSPHNLRPPSASTTPLPSPKLHTSPGSASSVHSMSPAAQHGHSCQKQQGSQMGANPHMERVAVPPLSHPPQQAQSLSQLFPDTSPCSANFASPPSGSSMKLKHMSPSSAQEQQNSNFMNSQKTNSFPQTSNQQQKNQYSVDKIIEHPNSNPAASSRLAESFNFTNMGSNVTTASSILPSGSMPLTSPNSNGFSFSLSPSSSQASSCSGNLNASNSSNNTNRGSLSSMQTSIPSSGGHMSHNASYLSPFFPPPTPMSIPASSSSSSSTHHSLAMHPLGNMEIQHTNTSRPSSGGSAATAYGMGPSSLMTYGNQPKLDIPPIVKSPTYNHSTPPTSSSGSNSNKGSNNVGSGGASYGSNSKQAMDSSTSSNRYPGSKSTPESIYQQQQKRPNTIQHPPSSHMDPMSHLSSSAHNNSFFPMAFPTAASASMPLRHLPDTRDMPSRSPYDYPTVPHHPAMGFPHPHSQIPSGYGAHASFTRDCARLETTSHHQTQQQQTQQPQQQPSQQQQQTQQQQNQQQQTQQQQNQQQSQQSPRKQSVPKKSSSSASVGGTTSSSSTNSSSSSNNSSNRNTNSGTTGSTINQGHSPASSTSSRAQPSQHHSNHQQTSASTSNNSSSSSSSHNRSSTSHNSQKRKSTSSSSSSSKKKNTASQHTGFPSDAMDASMSQNMFEFNYLNFPTLAQSMSPPAARPHQTDTPFLSGMFNAPPRPISNSGTKTADMAASHFPLSHTRAQNSFFQPGSFGMNFMTSNHSNAAAGISPHSMGVPPHMSFGLFGNETASATDNITSNKFLHSNPILPGGPHQSMDHSLQHGAHQTSLYHSRPHSAQSHVMAAFYPHSFDSRGHMGQPFNSSMGPPTFHTPGLPPINFSMHDAH
ncbi:serine-rich adhesin for platelets-like isoform X2 [Biomphalaria glabrata]|uniref:Serine-rich adhesin for platelets-like isoform X2 n=1 Tax=Biomphalaria glabrata TaxID=6526 RepID=A0A9W2YTQ8_BIOGL|nr:serine-rich adhesin for platelets-like isoform X2 [Biomphalaria glabrata]